MHACESEYHMNTLGVMRIPSLKKDRKMQSIMCIAVGPGGFGIRAVPTGSQHGERAGGLSAGSATARPPKGLCAQPCTAQGPAPAVWPEHH